MNVVQRGLLWTATVTFAAVVGIWLPVPLKHETAEQVFISSDMVLAGGLVVVAGMGDLLCVKIRKTFNFSDAIIFVGGSIAAVACGVAYVYLQNVRQQAIVSTDFAWAFATSGPAVVCGTVAVCLAEANRRTG